MNFSEWLLSQSDKESPIGDLARDANRDETFPRNARGIREVKAYLVRHHADEYVLNIFKEAVNEFSKETD